MSGHKLCAEKMRWQIWFLAWFFWLYSGRADYNSTVRLVGGQNRFEGRVEVYYNGAWGTVCDDSWDDNDATVVCRMLGYSTGSATAVCCARFGFNASLSIFLDDVSCRGNESSIYSCRHNGWLSHNCGHNEDAGVRCDCILGIYYDGYICHNCSVGQYRNSTDQLSCSPCPVGQYQNEAGQKTCTVCPVGTYQNQTGQINCQDCPVGTYQDVSGQSICKFCPMGSYTNTTGASVCKACEGATYQNSTGQASCLQCGENSTINVPGLISEAECYIDFNSRIRLVGGRDRFEGRVEVYYNGVWGTVCDDSWDNNDAAVVCRMLGYRTREATAVCCAQFGFNASLNIFLDDVSCGGKESSIYSCSHGIWLSHNCGHHEDAGVRCGDCIVGTYYEGHICQNCSVGQYRNPTNDLSCIPCPVGQYQNEAGQKTCTVCPVGTYQNQTGQINCQDCPIGTYQDVSGQSICKFCPMGSYTNTTGASVCKACEAGTYQNSTGQALCLPCGENSTASIPGLISEAECYIDYNSTIRLRGGQNRFVGRVEVYYNGAWGTVCDDSWDDNDAAVVCRMLGYSTGGATAVCCAKFGFNESLNIFLDDVSCRGNESSIYSCSHNGWLSHNCNHVKDAGVRCDCLFGTNYEGSICHNCSIGQYRNPTDQLSCNTCPVGQYQNETGQSSCFYCPVGTYQNQTGQINCQDCPIGTYQDAPGQSICKFCPTGSYTNQTGEIHCNDCPVGTYQDVSGQSICKFCPIGSYTNQTGATVCKACEIGTYQNSVGQVSCLPCRGNSTTSIPGLVSEAECYIGYNSTIRLVGGLTRFEGRVELYYNGAWGTICDDSWDVNDAAVVCRMLGYGTGGATAMCCAQFGFNASLNIFLDDVSCSGNESSIYSCSHSQWFSHNCNHNEDAGVRCDADFGSPSGEVGGIVEGNVSLSSDRSPYLVISNIEIKEEGTLSLEAGVTLKFKANLGIFVFGSLIALGNASHPVQLLSERHDQKWRGLEFKPKRGNALSTLRNIHVNNTLSGVSINGNFSEIRDIVSNFSQEHGFIFTITKDISSYYEITVENLIAANNSKSGVLIQSEGVPMNYPKVEIQSCLVYGNIGHGLNVEANATVIISKCHIVDNRLSGVYINKGRKTHLFSSVLSLNREYALNAYRPYEVLLESCNVTDHNYGSYTYWGAWNTRQYIEIYLDQSSFLNVTMKRNRFVNNTADGIRLYKANHSSSEYFYTLEDNIFQNGNRTLLILDRSYSFVNNIGHLTIRNNTFDNIMDSVFHLAYFNIDRVSTFSIMNNTFKNSATSNLIVITGNVDLRYNGNITIYENNFIDNNVKSAIVMNTYYDNITISENIFKNQGSECEVVGPDFRSTFSIDAKLNFWGESKVERVVEKVCGFEKNMTKCFIYYFPYYVDNMLQANLPQEQDTFNVDGALGGEVTGVVTLSKQMSPYRITRSIMLRSDSRLVIEDGARLYFEKDRGIYAFGSIQTRGTADSRIILDGVNGSRWFGIILNSTAAGASKLNVTHILRTRVGVQTHSPYFVISSCSISDSSGSGLAMSLEHGANVHDLAGTNILNTNGKGIYLSGNGNISIANVTIRNVLSQGIYLNTDSVEFKLTRSIISNCSKAIEVIFSSRNVSVNFSMENCTIDNNKLGVFISTQSYDSWNSINLHNNNFTNNKGLTLDINAASNQDSYVYDNGFRREVDIGYNYFENNGNINLKTWNLMNLTFHDNIVKKGNMTSSSNHCMLHALPSGSSDLIYRRFDISTNVFERNDAVCTIYLDASDYVVNGTFFYNQFLSNKDKDSVVKINTRHFKFSQNIFDNPDSPFDLYVTKQGNGTITAANNWWGSGNSTFVSNRIFDYRRDITLLSVNITPILTDIFDCSGVNNCSGHGECVRPNGCRCFFGYMGQTCSEYDCAGVNFCYGNGKCVGPDQCSCFNGWAGDQCFYATCNNVNNCSGHGDCIRPNVCTCEGDFTGNDCSKCVVLHWGPECKSCPVCRNGACDLNTGLCVCNANNWAGYLCDRCNETFYGPNCFPLMMALNIMPSQGIDKGGNLVHVWGHNFPETQNKTYFCKFGTNVFNGMWEAWNHVICTAPALPAGDIILEVSPDRTTYTNNKLVYTYYATCPPGACGRDLNPPHGQCMFGGCSCNLPWTGEGCNIELLSPTIQTPPAQTTVSESMSYSYQLYLTRVGSAPITWTLTNCPSSMTINEHSGLVEWKHAMAGSTAYNITAKASNIIGSHSITWSVMVPRSYSVQATSVEPNGIIPVPKPVAISGVVTFLGGSIPRVVPIDVRVISLSTKRTQVISELSNPLQPTTWAATYYPRPDDAGTFTVAASHPAEPTSNVTVTWSVSGMRCEPSSVSVENVIDNDIIIFQGLSKLINVGGHQMPAITAKVDGLSGAFVKVSGSNSNKSSEPFMASLNTAQEVPFDLMITGARPLSGTIYVIFASDDGTTTRLQVYIRLTVRRPLLTFNPNSISENIIRGTQMIVEVKLSNQGEVAAKNVNSNLPNDRRLSLVSFSNVKDNSSTTSEHIHIAPGDVALMSIAVTIPPDAGLGEMSGIIAVNSDLASATLAYRFFITSIQRLNLTFTVKDEYTYFASGAPLVSGAEVRLISPQRGYSEKRFTTNETGHVTFENIYEDQYTVYARADGHSSYSAVILAKPENNQMDIFLQRIAVKYTWTVTPTTVQDVYIIKLESTFETFVPMPVVTIEPAKVNTIPYELGQTDTIEFTIINHGRIRADNLRFSLPSSHPYLNFKSMVETIGSIEANTTLIVPVKVTLKSKTKRNAVAAAFCGLLLLYDYDCAGLQTRNLDVTLTREYPGRPPLPCGLGGESDGRGDVRGVGSVSYVRDSGSSSSGSSVSYNPVTPLSCDCAKTLIKSCALAYHPIVGCAYAVTDLGTSFARSGGDASLAAENLALGILDTAFACVIGVINTPAGLFWTTIRCLYDVNKQCGSARRRRDISSDVVENMIQATKPMDNFLKMLADIFGDEAMYNLNRTWFDSFKTVISDDSPGGNLLTANEVIKVLRTLVDQESKAVLNKFLTRWNNTAAAWKDGTFPEIKDITHVIPLNKLSPGIKQYLYDVDAARKKGFDSIFANFYHAANNYKTSEKQNERSGKDDGICAKVRVRIVQELVFIRDAFNARLEIENGEKAPLESIKVEIEIRQTYGGSEPTNKKFSIGKPTLNGITAVDGTGRLGMDLSGYAEWLMIPYSSAALQDDTQYDVGGRLSYIVGGSNFSVPLLPDTITVKPNPSLVVHYFHEKYVRGDDPLTQNVVEPVVPFNLAVMVMNAGYGIARALKISSAQPEIIENEKGLLVTFKIIGGQLGNNPISPSLTVNFGDINSFETKTARWLLTSTLKGTFYNYSATFENINPLGDPQLSLLDELGYHELIYLVRIDLSSNDDNLDDFLVNDVVDENEIPDRIFNSANGSDVQPVIQGNVTTFKLLDKISQSSSKRYKIVQLTVVTNTSSWFYARVENSITNSDPVNDQHLLQVVRTDGREIWVEKNAWQTTHIKNAFLFHLLDYVSQDSKKAIEISYNLTFGPRNMYAPKFNFSEYMASISVNAALGTTILILKAYDIDNDTYSFNLKNESSGQFSVEKSTGEITVAKTFTSVGTFTFVVIVKDSGIPSKSSFSVVTVEVHGRIVTSSPLNTTLLTTTMTSSSSSSTNETSTKPSTAATNRTTITTQIKPYSTASTLSTSASIVTDSTQSSSSNIVAEKSPTPTQVITTKSIMSTTPRNVTNEEEHAGSTPFWVIPTAIAAAVIVLLVITITGLIYALRKKSLLKSYVI